MAGCGSGGIVLGRDLFKLRIVNLWNNCSMGRGAPIGNKNALKHGFYSRQMRAVEKDDLSELVDAGLSNEIAILRILLRRAIEISNGVTDYDLAIRRA